MYNHKRHAKPSRFVLASLAGALFIATATGDTIPVQILDPNLQVIAVLKAGITQPIGIVFLSANDYLVLESRRAK